MMSKKLFKNLKAAMEDVIAHQRGELELESRTFTIPEPPAVEKEDDEPYGVRERKEAE